MALLRYFQREERLPLPKPTGILSTKIPCSSIKAANEAVKATATSQTPDRVDAASRHHLRGQYESFTDLEKTEIAKVASEIGVTKAIHKLEKKFPDKKLKESTVRVWVKKYRTQLRSHEKVEVLEAKRGRPLLLGNKLDNQVREYVLALRSNGAVINTAIVMAAATGIVKNHNSNLLRSNGGHIEITRNWCLSLLDRMGFVKRRSSTTAKISIADF